MVDNNEKNLVDGGKTIRFTNKIFIISLIILVLFSVSSVSAVQNDTLSTNEIDNVDNDILSISNETGILSDGQGTFNDLKNEILANNITLEKDYIAHSDEKVIDLTHSIEIDGKGHTIDGNGITGIFQADSSDSNDINVVLKNIVFKNGKKSGDGAAIMVKSAENVNIKIINCVFTNNRVSEDGGAIYYDSTGTLEITKSTFEKNTAEYSSIHNSNGGAVNTQDGTLIINDSKFLENTAEGGRGGAIYIKNSNNAHNHIKNSLFSKNNADNEGSAIYTNSKDGGLTVSGSEFLNNNAQREKDTVGGAITTYNGYLILLDSEFSDNQAMGCGAAVYAESKLTIDNTSFNRNHAYYGANGGAIYYNIAEDLKITNSYFLYNTADFGDDVGGGAIYINKKSNTIIENCEFSDNRVFGQVSGGAIYNDGSGTITLKNSQFNNNVAVVEGGVVYTGSDMFIDGCVFMGNCAYNAGGAIYCGGGISWGANPSIFKNNHVSTTKIDSIATKGGAVYASTFKSPAYSLIFENNQAGYGGAVYINNKNDVKFDSCVFYNNAAISPSFNTCGAAIYVDSSSSKVSLEYNIFIENWANDDKGIYNCGKYETISNNWWGSNNPDFNEGQIIEWHRFTSNTKHSDNDYLKILLTSDQTSMKTNENVKLTFRFVDKNGGDITGGVNCENVNFYSDKKSHFTSKSIGDNNATIIYTPLEYGEHIVTAKLYSSSVSVSLNVEDIGDFAKLQNLVDGADKELNLTRDYVYTIGNDYMTDGIVINKALTINGNGFTINALNKSRIFNIQFNIFPGNIIIDNITLINGYASDGGAILVYDEDNLDIRNCIFENNTAENSGGAIEWLGKNGQIKNSIFLNNKAAIDQLIIDKTNETLIFTLTGKENYINAIHSPNNVYFTNVTYWNGQKVTENDPPKTSNATGQNITLEIYNELNKIVKNITLKTNNNGQVVYNYTKFEDGNYTFKAYHPDDRYYTYIEQKGNFTLNRVHIYPSKVKINIENKTEFRYGECNISFEVTNRTGVRVLIMDADYAHIFYDEDTLLNYVELNLPAKDDYYRIIVANYGNETYYGSSDTKLFKIIKINSTTTIDSISDNITYGDVVKVNFTSDDALYDITVFDENKKVAYNNITDKKTVEIPNLNAGNYRILIVNCGSENKTSSNASADFEIKKKDNYFSVKVENTTYDNPVEIFVFADADGNYTVDLNSTEIIVNVEGGVGNASILLGAGFYYANVTFNNTNYNNFPLDTIFYVDKAFSPVWVNIGNITYGKNTTVYIYDNFPTLHNITIYDEGLKIVYHNLTPSNEFALPILDVGTYKIVVANLGNENITGSEDSEIFEVTMDNFVGIVISDVVYGRILPISIVADVDGYYYVDINGTEFMMEVIDGFGYNDSLNLGAGFYYANVTFDNPYYDTHIYNTTFNIYQAESNIEIYDIKNVTYGDDVIIEYIDDYNATFEILIINEDDVVVEYIETDEMKVEVPFLAAGNYTVIVTNWGNENITGLSVMSNFTVYKADPEMNVTVEYNEININLPEDATGEVSIIIDGVEKFYPVVDGFALIPLYDLKPGNYTFNVRYSGDKNYTKNNITVNVELLKITPDMNVTSKDNVINVVLPSDATGNVTVTVNGKNITVSGSGGKVTITLDSLDPGNYTADVRYSGNDNYYPRSEKANVVIPKITPNMNVTSKDNVISVVLPSDATGNVTVTVNGKTFTMAVSGGKSTITLEGLNPGNYTADVRYSGDDKYNPITEKVNVVISKIMPDMNVTSKDNVISVVLPNDATGNVTVIVNDRSFTGIVSGGKAIITLQGLSPGNYTADVNYSGDGNYYPITEEVIVVIPSIVPDMEVYKNNDEIVVLLPSDAGGNVTIEVGGEKLIVPVKNGKAEFLLDKLSSGDYNATITYSGDDKYGPVKVIEKISIDGIELFAPDVTKYYGGPERLTVTLLNNDKPIGSREIVIILNGVTYKRITDDKDQVSLGLNLNSGNYTAFIESEEYSLSTVVEIEIKSTIYAEDVVKIFRNETQYYALFLDSEGNPLASTVVEFNINGVFYYHTTNESGWADLNINLGEGEFILTAINPVTGEMKANNVTVISSIESDNLVKYYKNDSQFVARIHSPDGGWAKAGESVTFNINGVFYVRTTNATGHVKLNINLPAGNYIITTEYNGLKMSNNITVLPVLTADDLVKEYGSDVQFVATLVDGRGKAYANQKIEFNINGVFYIRTTDSAGQAKLNINLPVGEYIITSKYENGATVSNKITVKN